MRFALELGDLDALMDLIHKDLRFFNLSNSDSNLLSLWRQNLKWLTISDSLRNASLDLIINHLIQLRKRLLKLGRKHLTSQIQKRHCIDIGDLQEDVLGCNLLPVYQALISEGINTPSFLYPGRQSSMYHLSCIDTFVAEQLFRAGFHKLDSEDENGIRPVGLACRKGDPNLALWFLQHGAVPHESLVRVLFASLSRPNDAVKEIISLCGYPESDDCQCHCSSKGCLPLGILRKSPSKYDLQTDLQLWIQYIPQRSQREAYREACRFEVFERLEMSHTCCTVLRREFGTMPLFYIRQGISADDGCDIREEEQDFAVILDQYLWLFDQLWFEFTGDFRTYWQAWWSAIIMMLPRQDGSKLICDYIPRFSVVAYWHRHCDTQAGFEVIEEYGPHEKLIRWIVSQYSNVGSS